MPLAVRDLHTVPPEVRAYDVSLAFLPQFLEEEQSEGFLDLNPDFQRGHVWTPEQQERFLGHVLTGGDPGIIRFNIVGSKDLGMAYIVDGLQRLTAILKWLDNTIPAMLHDGRKYRLSDFDSKNGLRQLSVRVTFTNLNRKDMLDYYLRLNSGGTVHSQEELDRVRALLKKED